MNSRTQTAGKTPLPQNEISFGKRVIWILLVWGIQLLYLPTSERVAGGFEPKLSIDVFPVWPIWVVPYLLCYLLWFAGFAWAALKMSDRMFRAFALAFLFTCSVSVAIFLVFPTYVRPADMPGSDAFTYVLRLIHEKAGRYNALPSGHIYITALLVLFFAIWYPRYRWLWTFILVIVSFSTLFTAQHYILDILGGLVVAALGYYVGVKWTGYSWVPTQPVKASLPLPPSSKRVAD